MGSQVWGIYHRDAEYAKSQGEPLLGTVEAKDKDAAEQKAKDGDWLTNNNADAPTGYWAWRDPNAPDNSVEAPDEAQQSPTESV